MCDTGRFPSKEAAAWYLAAMIDGEGSIQFRPAYRSTTTGYRHGDRRVAVYGTEEDIMAAVEEAFTVLGFSFRKRLHLPAVCANRPVIIGTRPCIVLTLAGGRESYERFLREVPIQSDRKRANLEECVRTYVWRRREDQPSPEWLAREYGERLRSMPDIAQEWDTYPAVVRKWLLAAGITPRTISQSIVLHWRDKRRSGFTGSPIKGKSDPNKRTRAGVAHPPPPEP
jgi:hypothetical protein